MKGISEVIAIILILMIVIALSALAYTWFSGIAKLLFSDNRTQVSDLSTGFPLSSSEILSFMKAKGCDSLVSWWDGTLRCSRQDCKADGYCKYVYDIIN